jgi:acetolactate synthase-1/3 small subunit
MKLVDDKKHIGKYTIAALVNNKAGVLARVSGLFARRGFNIDSLAVGPTVNPKISRITIIVNGDEYIAEQVTKQLNKLVDVRKVARLSDSELTLRELVLIKVKAAEKERAAIIDIARIMDCEIVDISHETLTVEFDGRPDKVELLIELLKKYNVLEIARTGSIALEKGGRRLK